MNVKNIMKLDPLPWALFASSGIELDRHAHPRTASEFDPRGQYEQDPTAYGVKGQRVSNGMYES